MFALKGWLRQRRVRATDRRRRPIAPVVDALEARESLSVNGFNSTVNVFPQILPPNNKLVSVAVSGTIATNHPTAPNAFFFVTDEYRTDEPRGAVALTQTPVKVRVISPALSLYYYGFSFNVNLLAKRSTNTSDGRHYNVFVGASDVDGADGKTVRVLVPKAYHRSSAARALAVGPFLVNPPK